MFKKPSSRLMVLLVVVAALSQLSCQRIFSTSLAPFLARDGYSIPSDLSVEDAAYLLALDPSNTELAAALVIPLYNAADAATGTAAYDEAAGLLADAVIQASGIEPAIMSAVATIPLDGTATQEDLETVMAIFASVDLNANEIAALTLLESNPPSDITAEQSYAIAVVLLLEIANNIPGLDLSDPQSLFDNQAAISADPLYSMVTTFVTLGSSLGSTSTIGGLLADAIDAIDNPTP
ncbi:MAG: hypothetical protein E4H20_11675 [Spirochaetales bacterium]|nr:MAG: hypothetical protein E4H20_11675 [Spirochaetales bacterium]